MKESVTFYNSFDIKLIKDYLTGNPRTIAAIKKAISYFPDNSQNILDIGCGIGWTTYEFARKCNNIDIKGVDLSPQLLDAANKLFSLENLSFEKLDIASQEFHTNKEYDAAVLIDVYEHIPINSRYRFHLSLKGVINPQGGRIILTCPSILHQGYLRKERPDGLQPIDEDIDLTTMAKLAADMDGEIIHFEYVDIWHSFDYFHTVIEINPRYKRGKKIKASFGTVNLEPNIERENRIKRHLPELANELIKPAPSVQAKLKKKIKAIAKKYLQRS